MEDRRIIELYWARSEEAIVETDRKYGRYCYAIAYNILKNKGDSEECVNDTYLKTWTVIPPRRPGMFSAFLAKITRNLSLDRYKRNTAVKRGGQQVTITLEELGDCVPDGTNLEKRIADRELTELLNRFLSCLSVEQRSIFMLRYWYFCEVKDIAHKLGCSEGRVKMALMRGRKQLKGILEKEGIVL